MKLITRFILIYLLITAIVLLAGGVISFYIIKDEIDTELKLEFMERIDRVTYLLEKGRRFNPRRDINRDRNLVIRELDYHAERGTEIRDTTVWHDDLERNESNLKISAYRNVDGKSYYISTYGAIIESEDIREAVIKTLLWILGMQVIGAIGVGFFVSGRLFKPFAETLDRIRSFQLHNREPLPAVKTGIQEFDDLNLFVESMTRKAVSDYKNLKEFAENASHELQTPLAIAKGKLELLTESDLSTEQYTYVESLQRSVNKLSRLSGSLALLTKIENHEFTNGAQVNLSKLVQDGIEAFREFTELNNLQIHKSVKDQVYVSIHPALADIMWANLFQNAIRHNIKNGEIRVELTESILKVSNTGRKPNLDPDTLFERFKKADQSSDSIGLGLSIIRQITEQNNFGISYDYERGWHHITILLKIVK